MPAQPAYRKDPGLGRHEFWVAVTNPGAAGGLCGGGTPPENFSADELYDPLAGMGTQDLLGAQSSSSDQLWLVGQTAGVNFLRCPNRRAVLDGLGGHFR
jgi:hypothetical protein